MKFHKVKINYGKHDQSVEWSTFLCAGGLDIERYGITTDILWNAIKPGMRCKKCVRLSRGKVKGK